MLSVMAPKGFHRGCEYAGESCYVLCLPTQLDVKSFSSKFDFKIVGGKKKISGTRILNSFHIIVLPIWDGAVVTWLKQETSKFKHNWRKSMRKLSLI